MKDIQKMNSDILCLQELEQRVYDQIQKEFKGKYKASSYVQRKGLPDGSATFYDAKRFELVKEKTIDLDKCFDFFEVEE